MGRSATWVLIAACALSACASAEPQGGTPSSTPPRATSTTFDRAAEETAVIAAYLAEIDAFYLASNPPNPDHPALTETATGDLLVGVRQRLTDLRDKGHAIRQGDQTVAAPRVTRITSGAAIVEDCGTDGDVTFEVASGRPVDDSVIHGRVTARLVRIGSRWLVETRSVDRLDMPCE